MSSQRAQLQWQSSDPPQPTDSDPEAAQTLSLWRHMMLRLLTVKGFCVCNKHSVNTIQTDRQIYTAVVKCIVVVQ